MSQSNGAPILVIEDDREFAEDLLALWHPAGAVHVVGSVQEALESLHSRVPRLVLLDLCLPDSEEEGLRLLARIRSDWGRQIPVVVITRSDSEEIRERALRLGASAFLGKPIDVFELDRVVSLVTATAA